MANISGTGTLIKLIASITYPLGIDITSFSDDTDSFVFTSSVIGYDAMGVNGDHLTWSRAVTIPWDLSVVPNSENDKDLQVLWSNNYAGKGKITTNDNIQVVINYPDGSTVSLLDGILLSGDAANSVSSDGRLKTKVYKFSFGNITRTFS